MLKSRKGQAALIMIIILAVAFIFYAIEMNWSKTANWKMTTWMAATSSASSVASNFASYGERVMWESLILRYGSKVKWNGGNLQYVHKSLGVFLLVLVWIVMVIIIIVTWGAGTPWCIAMIILVTAMMLYAGIMQYCVIMPGMFEMWNKLSQNLTVSNRFQEAGIMSGQQSLSTDPVNLPDRFDWDGNGRWGFKDNGFPKDKTSRYGLYYSERMKLLKPPDTSAYEAFRKALDNLVKKPYSVDLNTISGLGFDSYCTSSGKVINNRAPQCDSQCTGIEDRPSNGGNVQYVPSQCLNACQGSTCPPVVDSRPLIYDPSLELPPPGNPFIPNPLIPGDQANSFRSRLGHDDEIGKSLNYNTANVPITDSNEPGYNPDNAKGIVFPMLNQMASLWQDNGFGKVNGADNPGLSTYAMMVVGATANTDNALLQPTDPFLAKEDDCAMGKDSASGFFWKKGADRYCSDTLSAQEETALITAYPGVFSTQAHPKHWPYNECAYMLNANGQFLNCPNVSGNLWPQDRLDGFVYKLSELIYLNKFLQSLDGNTLITSASQWYGQVSSFIAPQCTAAACLNYNNACLDSCDGAQECIDTCNSPDLKCTGSTGAPLDTYLKNLPELNLPQSSYNNFASDAAACNPSGQGYMAQWVYDLDNWQQKLDAWQKKSFGTSTDLCSGTLENIVSCLNNNKIYVDELTACKKDFPVSSPAIGTTVDLKASCVDLIRLEQHDTVVPFRFFTSFTRKNYDTMYNPVVTIPTVPAVIVAPYSIDDKEYAVLKAWLEDNSLLKSTVSQRYDHLNKLNTNAKATVILFQEGRDDFKKFLEGPAVLLMAAQGEVDESIKTIKRLPGFEIYGWKDEGKNSSSGVKQGGMWHISRTEVKSHTELPYIKIKSKTGFFITKTYYTFTDGNHDVLTRATRWDENTTGGQASFANKIPIWRFIYGNPAPLQYSNITGEGISPDDVTDIAAAITEAKGDEGRAIEDNCIGTPILSPWGKGIGLTKDTRTNLKANGLLSTTSDEAKSYQGAFMINIDPRMKIPDPQQYYGDCSSLSPTSYKDNSLDSCKTRSDFFTVCCTSLTGTRWNYGQDYCLKTNKSRCEKNIQNQQLYKEKENLLKCFVVADYLLNTGVQSIASAHYGVPDKGKIDPTITEWHEQVSFSSPRLARHGKRADGVTKLSVGSFDKVHTLLDTDIY